MLWNLCLFACDSGYFETTMPNLSDMLSALHAKDPTLSGSLDEMTILMDTIGDCVPAHLTAVCLRSIPGSREITL